MKSKIFILHTFITLGFLTCLIPHSANAMKIFVDMPESAIRVGNTTLLKIMVDTEGQEINAVEGKISIDSPASITSITTGGSILSLWPRKPSLEDGFISFTGGTPSGVYGNSLRLFTIALKPTTAKNIKIGFTEIAGFLNDGNGTKISATGSSIEIPVQVESPNATEDNELAALVLTDTTPPNKFSIDLGREESLHDGKYFISFYATDNDSGINRYEVKENDFQSVRSGNIYVLQDQSLVGTVEVRAIDNAGNVRMENINLNGGESGPKTIVKFVLILVAIVALFVIVFKIRKIRRQRNLKFEVN